MSKHWQYLMPLNAAIDDRVALVGSGTLGTCRCLAIRPSLAALPTELQQNEIIHAVLGHRNKGRTIVSKTAVIFGRGSFGNRQLGGCRLANFKKMVCVPKRCGM